MNKEDYNKYYIQGSDHYLIPKDEFIELFDEMINWREESKQLQQENKQLKKILNEIKSIDIFKEFSFPLMKRWEEQQVLSSIDYQFKTTFIKKIEEFEKEEH